jgi:quercetin dioxygenase-like cupin family protein
MTSVDAPDPVITDPDRYRVIFENESVRVLEYTDSPGDSTHDHAHPDSVMVALTSFRRRLVHGGQQREVEIAAGFSGWVPAQQHRGENIGDTPSHAVFVELKKGRAPLADGRIGPD